ncbi:MAG: hypothetical protein BRD37_06095 [Bacteroidetes bacterium QH_8_67_23]|nr:MAG: hypothetical protein BRD37_06095 [Bacteroidetes bacterium QH_8_67_23]
MKRLPSFLALLATGLLALTIAGCDSNGDDGDAPSTLDGTFEATTFTITREPFGEVDVIEDLDGSLTMNFDGDGTVVADVEATAPLPGQDDIDERAEGTYELAEDGRLTFDFGEEGEALRQALREQLGEEPDFTYDDGEIRTSGDGYEIVLERR